MSEKHIAGLRLPHGRYKLVYGEHYGTPKEVWGFRTARATVSAARAAKSPEQAARAYVMRRAHPRRRGYRPTRCSSLV